MNRPETLAEHALKYAGKGYEVFPVDPHTKAPIGNLAPNGNKSATTDTDTIRHWWTQRPDALIGCRIPKGVTVLDIDPRHGGQTTWDNITAGLALPDTLTIETGRGDGGQHHWFTTPDVRFDGTLPGIDILTHDHRYSILPPSPHPETGQPYKWANTPRTGNRDTPADAPAWLLDAITPPPPTPPRTRLDTPPDSTHTESIADTYSDTARWTDILGRHGWTVVQGDGDHDGSKWRHPNATAAWSATIRERCLFVYTPNTEFEPTETGRPHGYTPFRATAVLDHGGDMKALAAHLRPAETPPTYTAHQQLADTENLENGDAFNYVDWTQFWVTDHTVEDFLCAPILARGRGHALYAAAKQGKSLLTLEMVAAIALGRPFLDQPAGPPATVLYLDYEMVAADLYERLDSMGYDHEDDLRHLHYAHIPSIPALDTREGGHALNIEANRIGAALVVIDTTARAASGEENAAETTRDLYRHSLMPLKANGITTLRIDHAGKDAEKGQRGSSAKNDDVDIVWRYTTDRTRGTGLLTATHRRLGWVPETVEIALHADPPRHRTPGTGTLGAYAPGAAEKAAELDALNVPDDWSPARIRSATDIGGRKQVVLDAQRMRRSRNEQDKAA